MKVVRLPVIHTGRLYPHETFVVFILGVTTTAVADSGLPSQLGDSSGGPARARPTPLLSSSCDGKPEAATGVVVTPEDRHEDARNMLSCI
jgi:hypothetical protein